MPELEYNKSTDQEHEEKLDSFLIYAEWKSGSAYAGQTATFEIGTSFVGNGAKIKITGKSENGKKLGKITDTIKNNKYIGEFEIPEDIEIGDEIYFEVDLSKNGLDDESSRIPVFPAPKVSNMKWSAKEARRGDTLTLSADIEKVVDETEVMITIYEYDQDGAHDKITEFPAIVKNKKVEVFWDYEYHEDTDEVPSQEEMERYGGSYNPPEYFFTIKIGEMEYGKDQESGILGFRDWMEIYFSKKDGTPIPNENYILHMPDGTQRDGVLDEKGYAREEGIPPGIVRVEFPNFANVSKKETENE
jgi:hypothetical protein